MPIRAVRKEDHDAIWQILEPAIRAGDTYPLPRDMDKAEAIPHWTGPDREAFVAEKDGRIIGTYYLRANQAGGGAHVANCGYVTADDARGRGVARSMCEHSLLHARERGFRAMQFNFVISTNEQAIRLWESLGFIRRSSPARLPPLPNRLHGCSCYVSFALTLFVSWLRAISATPVIGIARQAVRRHSVILRRSGQRSLPPCWPHSAAERAQERDRLCKSGRRRQTIRHDAFAHCLL
jgi:ribosomal protein S18 acetylase RimI-like enzyme